jgi:predicted SnoaL-like aldol condensation-catalyzing enzyme
VSTEQNKAVVRRWMTEILEGGRHDLIDEVLADDYRNPAMGDADRDGMRAILAHLHGIGPWRIPTIELIAEGDDVVARFVLEVTRPDGEKVAADGLTYYRLANGRIVADDPFTRPDLAQVLGLAPPAG